MPSTFGILESARSGLNAAQIGLNITSQNISNANTTGYTRQEIDASSNAPDTGAFRYRPSNTMVGQGVKINNVYQVRDSFLDVSYRNQNSQYSMWNGMQSQMTPIEDVFNEVSDSTTTDSNLTGLSGQLTDLITSLQNYQASPDNSNLSSDVESKMDMLTQSIRDDASQLTTTLSNEKSELNIVVSGGTGDTENGDNTGGINGILDSIQQLNVQISSYENGTGQKANDLRDQRNNLLDQLSSNLDITTTEQSDGMVSVTLQDDNTHSLIDTSNKVTHLTVGTDSGSNATVVQWDDGTGNYPTAAVQGGLVKAYLNVMNGDGSGIDDPTTGQCGNVGIPYLEKKLNDFAMGLYNVMNNVGNAVTSSVKSTGTTELLTFTGDTSSPTNTSSDPVVNPTTISSTDPLYVASTISVTKNWSNDSTAFINNYNGSDNGTYLTDFANSFKSATGTVPLSSSTNYSGTLSQYADSFTQDIATAVSTITSKASWSKTNTDNINEQRLSISSVSTDDEGVNIIKYQQAYNANARVITVINDMLNTLINNTGTT